MTSRKQHPSELRERAVAMVFELRAESGSARGSLASVVHKLGRLTGRGESEATISFSRTCSGQADNRTTAGSYITGSGNAQIDPFGCGSDGMPADWDLPQIGGYRMLTYPVSHSA